MNIIKKLREERGFSQKKLAELANVPQTSLCYYERGQRSIKTEQLERLINVLVESENKVELIDIVADYLEKQDLKEIENVEVEEEKEKEDDYNYLDFAEECLNENCELKTDKTINYSLEQQNFLLNETNKQLERENIKLKVRLELLEEKNKNLASLVGKIAENL